MTGLFLAIIAIIVVIVLIVKKENSDSNTLPYSVIMDKVKSSECTRVFTEQLVHSFSPDGEQYDWLLTNSSE